MAKLEKLEKDLAAVLNKHGVDAMANTPDFILAAYVVTCIAALKTALVTQAMNEGVNHGKS